MTAHGTLTYFGLSIFNIIISTIEERLDFIFNSAKTLMLALEAQLTDLSEEAGSWSCAAGSISSFHYFSGGFSDRGLVFTQWSNSLALFVIVGSEVLDDGHSLTIVWVSMVFAQLGQPFRSIGCMVLMLKWSARCSNGRRCWSHNSSNGFDFRGA